QVQVCEQLLTRAEPVIFLGDGLLALADQVRGSKHLVCGADNPGAGRNVLVVGKATARPSAGLHHDLSAVVDQLGNAVGLQRYPAFLLLDLLRHTNQQPTHTRSLLSPAHIELVCRRRRPTPILISRCSDSKSETDCPSSQK